MADERTDRVRRGPIARLVGLLLATLVLVTTALPLAIALGWQRERIRSELEAALARALGAPVSVGALEGPLYPHARLRDVVVGSPLEPAVALENLELRLDPLAPIRWDAFTLRSIVVDGLRAGAVQREDGSLGLAGLGPLPATDRGDDAPPGVIERLRIDRIVIRRSEVSLRVQGDVALVAQVAGSVRRVPLEFSERAIRRAEAELDLTLAWGEPRAEGRLALGLSRGALTATAQDVASPMGPLAAELNLDLAPLVAGRSADLGARVQGRGFALAARGTLTNATTLGLELSGEAPDLSALAPSLPAALAPLAGSVTLSGALRGTPAEPTGWLALRGEALVVAGSPIGRAETRVESEERGVIELVELALPDAAWPVALVGAEPISIRDGAIGVAALTLLVAEQVVELSGRADAEGFHDVSLHAPAVDAAALARHAAVEAEIGGTLRAAVGLDGPFARPRGQASLVWSEPQLGGASAGRLELELRAETSRFHAALGLFASGSQVLDAALSLPRGDDLPDLEDLLEGAATSATVHAHAFDLAALAPLVPQAAPLVGLLDASVELAGPLRAPAGSLTANAGGLLVRGVEIGRASARITALGDGELRVEELALAALEVPVRLAPGARISLGGDGLALQDFRLIAREREVLSLEAQLPYPVFAQEALDQLAASPQTRVSLRGQDVDLELLDVFTPAWVRAAQGRASFDISLEGDPQVPRFRGSLRLVDGSVIVAPLEKPLSPLAASITFDDSRIQVKELTLGPPGADARLSGEIALAGLRPTDVDLALALDGLAVRRQGLLETSLEGNLAVTGSTTAPELTGRVVLARTRVELPKPRDPVLREIRVVTSSSQRGGAPLLESTIPTPFERAIVDVELEVPDDAKVRGRGADLEIGGLLALRKQPLQRLRIEGALTTTRGSYRIHGRSFEIRQARATFDGPDLDPDLDVEAVRRVSDVTILALIDGRLSAPRIRLESEPALADEDVVAYLLFGQRADDAQGSAVAGSAAMSLALGVALDELDSYFEALPVDSVDVRIEEEGGPFQVSVGRRIGRRLSVRYGHSFGSESDDEVGVEFQLDRNWSIGSEITRTGSAGGDLQWSIDY